MQTSDLRARVRGLLETDPGLSVKSIAEELEVNRIYIAGFLEALELEGYVRSKRIGPARVYFLGKSPNHRKR